MFRRIIYERGKFSVCVCMCIYICIYVHICVCVCTYHLRTHFLQGLHDFFVFLSLRRMHLDTHLSIQRNKASVALFCTASSFKFLLFLYVHEYVSALGTSVFQKWRCISFSFLSGGFVLPVKSRRSTGKHS